MRRITAGLLMAMSFSCISIPRPMGASSRERDATKVMRAAVPVAALAVREIREKLSRARDSIPERREQLQITACSGEFVVRVSLQELLVKCYSANEIRRAVTQIRTEVASAFPEDALASRLSLDEEIAKIVDERIAPSSTDTNYLVSNPPPDRSPRYEATIVDAIFVAIRSRVDQLLSHDTLNPTIHVSSDPKGAHFSMQIGENRKTLREGDTNTEVPSVWRGHYTGCIQKRGYRDAIGVSIDLMNDRRTAIQCHLVALAAAGSEESVCRMED